jgi:hypothetical protein
MKTMLKSTPRFWGQRSVMLCTFRKMGSDKKFLNIWVNSNKIFENAGYTVFGIYE